MHISRDCYIFRNQIFEGCKVLKNVESNSNYPWNLLGGFQVTRSPSKPCGLSTGAMVWIVIGALAAVAIAVIAIVAVTKKRYETMDEGYLNTMREME